MLFNHVICCGVLHFLGDLSKLIGEIKRVLKTGGVFSFTIAPGSDSTDFKKEPTAWGLPIFKHAPEYVYRLLSSNWMTLLKEQRLLIKGADKKRYNMELSAMVSRNKKTPDIRRK